MASTPARAAAKVVQLEIAEAIRRAVAEGFAGVNGQLAAFLRGMDVGAKGDMEKANKAVAKDMRTAVVDAYERNVEGVRKVSSYDRPGRRAGYLGKVIRRNDLVTADAQGIYFIDEKAINKEAAHWRRLNFGAGPEAGPQPGPVPVRLFGETIMTASLPYGPSPAFALPKGFFIQGGVARIPTSSMRGAGSVGQFTPSRKSPYRPAMTVGIRGRHFLQAGLEALAVSMNVKYADMLNEWIQRGGRKARAITGPL